MRTLTTISLALLAGCPKPPPPPSVGEPVRLPAEEGCDAARTLPPLPARPAADPYQLAHPELLVAAGAPIAFLCDLPDRILAVAATQTVDGGKRVVGGSVVQIARGGPALPTLAIAPSSPGCRLDQPTCDFVTSDAGIAKLAMLREQWIHTGGWVSGREDMCRALPDDTIAVCATLTKLAYVELGCGGAVQLAIHDTSLPRAFDLDVEVPNARRTGQADPTNGGTRWRFAFPKGADLTLDLDPGNPAGTLVLDGKSERCIVFGLYRP